MKLVDFQEYCDNYLISLLKKKKMFCVHRSRLFWKLKINSPLLPTFQYFPVKLFQFDQSQINNVKGEILFKK